MFPTPQHDIFVACSISLLCYSMIKLQRHFEAGMAVDELFVSILLACQIPPELIIRLLRALESKNDFWTLLLTFHMRRES